ncbi:MAG: hypothetical protein ABSD28_18925, partial [Tepidisphaeraceae bacterium]
SVATWSAFLLAPPLWIGMVSYGHVELPLELWLVLLAVRQLRREIEIRDHRPAPMYIPFDYAHLDRDGHRALAEAFARSLLAAGVISSSTGK